MPRQQRNVRLQTRDARRQLAPNKEPYWHELRRGLHVGYYKGTTAGTWLIREYRGPGNRPKRRVGQADDAVAADGVSVYSWEQVLKLALGDARPTIAPAGTHTVENALTDYWGFREAKSPAASVLIDRTKIKAHVGDKLRARPVAELTTDELERWLYGLVPKTEDREKQRKGQATALRVWRIFRAALEQAYRNHRTEVPLSDAWRAVRAFRNVDRPRQRTLSLDEAKRLLNAMPADFRRLARGALYTGLRLGELLALRGSDVADGQVHVRHSKAGKPRTVPLSPEGAQFFESATAGLSSDALVFMRDPIAEGEPAEEWQRMHISRGMKRACTAATISPPAVFHDLRRSYGSLMLNRGAEVEVIQELLGHADLRMTQRAYAHLLQSTMAKVVKRKLPNFGLEKTNVRKLRS